MSGIGLLGGAFDPPHLGHRALAEAALRELQLDRVIVLPTGQAAHKTVHTAAELRLALTNAAFKDAPGVTVSDWELLQPGPSYTLHTLCFAREKWGEDLYFIVGTDEFASFPNWHDPEGILALARLAVGTRAGSEPDTGRETSEFLASRGIEERVVFFDVPPVPVASSDLRRELAGCNASPSVDPAVIAEIDRLGLYGR